MIFEMISKQTKTYEKKEDLKKKKSRNLKIQLECSV